MALGRVTAKGMVRAAGLGALVIACGFVIGNRETLARACLHTVDGVTSKFARFKAPFGSGAIVEAKNPVMGIAPQFKLTERSGRTVDNAELKGSYWVASFIFTRCVTSCPIAVGELVSLRDVIPKEVRFVSFSVDPTYDTPEVLREYADRFGADADNWLFLTGDKREMIHHVREGFHLSMEDNEGAEPGWAVTHSPRFALVDPQGRIRGYYTSSEQADMDRLVSDLNRLLGREEESTS